MRQSAAKLEMKVRRIDKREAEAEPVYTEWFHES
jgi:hypothetical protein